MAGPAYKPLAVSVQGGLPGVFDTASVSFEDAQKQAEALQAQELANQINSINAEKATRANENSNQLREALRTQFGQQPDGSTAQFDPDQALQLAQSLAIQQGDLETALTIERTQKERSATRSPLTEAQRGLFEPTLGRPVPEGTTMQDLTTLGNLQRSSSYADQTQFNLNNPNVGLRAQKLAQELAGEQIRPMRAADAIQIGELDEFGAKVDNVRNTYMPFISENRGERFLAAAVNPNSAAARMKNELDLIATELAAAYNGQRLSDLDFRTMSKLVSYSDLDTIGTIADKFDRLKEFTSMKRTTMVDSLEKGGFNVGNFKNQQSAAQDPIVAGANSANAPIMIPRANAPAATGGIPRNPDGSPLTREQFMALKNQGG